MKKYKVNIVFLDYWYEFLNTRYNKNFIVVYNRLENISDILNIAKIIKHKVSKELGYIGHMNYTIEEIYE